MPMPNSSTATADSCAFCALGLAGSFATSGGASHAELEAVFAWPLSRADQIRSQQQRQRGWKLYSFHAPEVECIGLTGREIERAYVDKGYRGHHAPNPRRVFISGQKRGVFGRIKRELTRRSAIEAVIGHMKAEGHLGRCYLKGRAGDAANVILSAVGYNLRLVLAWLRTILRVEIGRAHV